MSPALRKAVRPPTIRSMHVPAPVGGLDTVSPLGAMPEGKSVWCYNLIGAEGGLRSRLGFEEWCTSLTGAADATVRTTVPFSGSHKNGSTDKLFGCTQAGIWDVSASSSSPSKLVTFGTQTGDAGFGISHVCTTPAGRYLLHCDEENGLYHYPEASGTWAIGVSDTTVLWAPNTDYLVNDLVVNDSPTVRVYKCITAGTSAGSGGPTGTNADITDNTVHWQYQHAQAAHAIGPSLADQRAGYTALPSNFAFVTVWKGKVWLVEKDTTRAWYLATNAVYGTATSFDFGSKMRAGGPLVGLYGWSYDGGSGLDTLLVGISTAGDIVIFQGTDPTSASTFGLKGTWSVGGVPYGRRIATDYGGDILILSTIGIIPLSKLIVGQPVVAGDRSLVTTGDIANKFNLLVAAGKSLRGWSLTIHPTDNALLVMVPTADGQATVQLAMSFATRGWSQYRDLPILSTGVWNGTMYFGTADGRVCVNTGYVDNVLLSNSSAYSPVSWGVLPAFQNEGTANHKKIEMVLPTVESQGPSPIVQCTARYNFDLSEPAPPQAAVGTPPGTWDSATWDSTLWGGDYTESQPMSGASGFGRSASVAIQGLATSRTVLVGYDVMFVTGGLL